MFLLYNCFLTLLAPLWIIWMVVRTRSRKESPNWAERQGRYTVPPRKDRKRIWIHAVSVGEVVAAMPILRELRQELPDFEIVLSVTTSSGHQIARERASDLHDVLIYMPIDVARFAMSAIQQIRPAVVAIMETELWFNFLWAAKIFGCRTLLLNGRISDRNIRRSRYFRFFYRSLFRNLDRSLVQSEKDAERMRLLGAHNVEVFGNCKFDEVAGSVATDASLWREELEIASERAVVVIGSTRGEAEAEFVLDALDQVGLEKLQVVHAPRHLETVPHLISLLEKRGIQAALRSKGERGQYLILDTYGELAQVYSVADIAIVGGGFSKMGGQNLIQPLALGKPVLHGPYMANFRDVASQATRSGASRVCRTPSELAECLNQLIEDSEDRRIRGEAALDLVAKNVGASTRYAKAIVEEADRFIQLSRSTAN